MPNGERAYYENNNFAQNPAEAPRLYWTDERGNILGSKEIDTSRAMDRSRGETTIKGYEAQPQPEPTPEPTPEPVPTPEVKSNESEPSRVTGRSLEELAKLDISTLNRNELLEMKAIIDAENARRAAIANSAPTEIVTETPQNSSLEGVTDPEPVAPEVANMDAAKASYERAKQDPTFKDFLYKKVAPIALGVSILAGGLGAHAILNSQPNAQPGTPTASAETQDSASEKQESKIGIKDGYNKKGLFLSKNKPTNLSFASAVEVGQMFDGDECEMIKYVSDNQSESMASYIAHLPKQLQPEGFQGLSIVEAEQKLESLSDEDYEKVQAQFNEAIDQAFTRTVTAQGQYDNVLMDYKDSSGPTTHGNMEAVKCVTSENEQVRQLYWNDEHGHEIGSMTVKIIVDGSGHIIGGCTQPISKQGSNPAVKSLPTRHDSVISSGSSHVKKENPKTGGGKSHNNPNPNPDPDPDPGGGSKIKPKDAENLKRIDDKIDKDIAKDTGTKEIKHNPNPGVSESEKTEKPAAEEYEGTAPETTQNEVSQEAEPVQEQVSEVNDYSEDKGGANSEEYAPVQENVEAQEEADKSATPVEKAPTDEKSVDDALEDLDIE